MASNLPTLDEKVLTSLASLLLSQGVSRGSGCSEVGKMAVYLQKVGISMDQFAQMPVIHVAGTKGKGSTCAMVESMLRHCGYKTGLYTSPHLVDVRERMRMNGVMVSKELFEHHFWDCYAKLKESAEPEAGHPKTVYFRLLTLLAFKLFLSVSVDVVVLEVGVGGRLDATNVVPAPIVCGITALGFDHMELLGDTLPKIAREKAGILKPGRPGFTVQQAPEALQALQDVAASVGAPLTVTDLINRWKPADGSSSIQLSLGGAHQLQNAGLAVQLCQAFEQDGLNKGTAKPGAAERLAALQQGMLPVEYMQGLANTSWPGRCQIIQDEDFLPSPSEATGIPAVSGPVSRLSFFIDGAHTPESLAACADWFGNAANDQPQPPGTSQTQRVLLFSCMKDRDPAVLLPALSGSLAAAGIRLDHALFAPLNSELKPKSKPSSPPGSPARPASPTSETCQTPSPLSVQPLAWQQQLQHVWQTQCGVSSSLKQGQCEAASPRIPSVPGLPHQASQTGAVVPSLGNAVDWLKGMVRSRPHLRLQVLVTGSLYLVGDVLKLLSKAPK